MAEGARRGGRARDPRPGRPGARDAALEIVAGVVLSGRSLEAAAAAPLEALADHRERALARELSYGVLRWRPRLAALERELLSRELRRRDEDVRLVIHLGLYQLLGTRIPAHAAVSESVRLVRARGKRWAEGLVNAVLRRFLREREGLLARVDQDDAAALAHPRWLVETIRAAWPARWREVLAANNVHAPMTLRTNARRVARDQYLARLSDAGIAARATRFSPVGVTLDAPRDVLELPGFAEGLVSVQDEAAQLAATTLGVVAGDRVLDACAAPGGKTAHLLELPAAARVVAVERDAARYATLRAGLARLGLHAELINADARDTAAWWDGTPFDRILLDAPCSATGVIRRHPDIKSLRRASDLASLAATQLELLSALWPLLARGGTLLYATCSLLPEENDRVVQRFVDERPEALLQPIRGEWGVETGTGRQILPGEDAMDGFFFASLHRG